MDLGVVPDLTSYRWLIVNSSAGKDSQSMLDYVVEQADGCGVRDRIVVVHCDLGRVEWQGTRELAEEQANHYGLRFIVVKRRQGDLLEHVEKRGKWPSPKARYCTSDHKRAQGRRVMTQLTAEAQAQGCGKVRILNCMGFRAEESPARRKRQPFSFDKNASNGKRHVDEWLPIHHWTLTDVWTRIRRSGVRHHWAYDIGMPRLSCVFCIFNLSRNGLLLAGHHNKELLAEYVRVERKIQHKFSFDISLEDIQRAVDAGEQPQGVITWAKCA